MIYFIIFLNYVKDNEELKRQQKYFHSIECEASTGIDRADRSFRHQTANCYRGQDRVSLSGEHLPSEEADPERKEADRAE